MFDQGAGREMKARTSLLDGFAMIDYVFQAVGPMQIDRFPVFLIDWVVVGRQHVLEMPVETIAKTSPRLGHV